MLEGQTMLMSGLTTIDSLSKPFTLNCHYTNDVCKYKDVNGIEFVIKDRLKTEEHIENEILYSQKLFTLNPYYFLHYYGMEEMENSYLLYLESCSYDCEKKPEIAIENINLFTRTLLKSVELLHSRGIAHQDIKLENILFCPFQRFKQPNIRFKLMDYEYCSDAIVSDYYMGTPMYSAPEVLQFGFNKKSARHFRSIIANRDLMKKAELVDVKFNMMKGDIYAMGATLGRLLDIMHTLTFKYKDSSSVLQSRYRCYTGDVVDQWYTNTDLKIQNKEKFIHLIQWMTSCDPNDRPTATKALEYFESTI